MRLRTAFLSVLALLALAATVKAADNPRPNILFLLADDQAYDTVGALGNREIQTPNLDRLVERGVTFTHAYNQGGWHGAVCVASRTMLNTGLSLWRAQAAEKNLNQWVQQRRLWPQLLASQGYDTYFTGKWHVKADPQKVFQVTRHVRGGMPSQSPQGYNRPLEGKEDAWKPWDPQFGGFWKGGKHWSEVVADDAIDFLATARKSERPFFMYIAFNAPHDPRQSPREYVEKYPLDKLSLPEPFLPQYPFDIGSNHIRDETLAPFPRTEHAVKVHRQEYYAIISHLDAQVGRILAALEASGQAENTYIVYTADHGLACGHHGLMGKQNMYDHSMRVPFVVAGPGIACGERIKVPIYLQDIVPTTLAWAGAKVSEEMDFRSLVPLLRGEADDWRDTVYGAYMDHQRMITRAGYKLIGYHKLDKVLLYHVEQDPHEIRDLASNPNYAGQLTQLKADLFRLAAELDDPLFKKLEQ